MTLIKSFKIIVILTTILVINVIILLLNTYTECFEKDKNVISVLPNTGSGFYAGFFCMLNHYIYCKKHKKNFKILSENWLFKKQDGWTDYFKNIELKYNDDVDTQHPGFLNILEDFPIKDYKYNIPELYIYNENTIHEIQKTKERLNVLNKNYDSIFIRRGDKLIDESVILQTDDYLKLLLKKNPNCKTIFLQTDDYNTYIELQKYNEERQLQLEIITLCDKNMTGVIVYNHLKPLILNPDISKPKNNQDYLSTIKSNIENTKSVNEMNPDEIYNHTMTMIIGIDIIANSNICICDYQSNVARFIKLFHKNSDNVFDVMNENTDIDYNKKVCPVYTLSMSHI